MNFIHDLIIDISGIWNISSSTNIKKWFVIILIYKIYILFHEILVFRVSIWLYISRFSAIITQRIFELIRWMILLPAIFTRLHWSIQTLLRLSLSSSDLDVDCDLKCWSRYPAWWISSLWNCCAAVFAPATSKVMFTNASDNRSSPMINRLRSITFNSTTNSHDAAILHTPADHSFIVSVLSLIER